MTGLCHDNRYLTSVPPSGSTLQYDTSLTKVNVTYNACAAHIRQVQDKCQESPSTQGTPSSALGSHATIARVAIIHDVTGAMGAYLNNQDGHTTCPIVRLLRLRHHKRRIRPSSSFSAGAGFFRRPGIATDAVLASFGAGIVQGHRTRSGTKGVEVLCIIIP